jgi:hypothetical protein
MKSYYKNKWSRNETNAVLGTVIVIGLLILMFFWGKGNLGTATLKQEQFFVSGTGDNIENAFDDNEETVWMGNEGYYSNYNYVIMDFNKNIDINSVQALLGGEGQPIDYIITIQSSKDGNIWNDVIGMSETGYFTNNTWFKYEFIKQNCRYLKFGLKPYGSFEKFRVYEIKVN